MPSISRSPVSPGSYMPSSKAITCLCSLCGIIFPLYWTSHNRMFVLWKLRGNKLLNNLVAKLHMSYLYCFLSISTTVSVQMFLSCRRLWIVFTTLNIHKSIGFDWIRPVYDMPTDDNFGECDRLVFNNHLYCLDRKSFLESLL